MKSGPSQQSFRSRLAAVSDVPALIEINRRVCPAPFNNRTAEYFHGMIDRSPGYVFVVENKARRIFGWAHCLPMADAVTKAALLSSPKPWSLLSPSNVIDTREAMAQTERGNACWVGLEAVESGGGVERYDHAVPLFLELLWAFYRLFMKEMFAHTKTEMAANIAQTAGAVKIRDLKKAGNGGSAIWHFDENAASRNIASGLSVAYFTRWAGESSHSKLGLSHREREIVIEMMQGRVANHELVKRFGISADTLKSHLNNIFIKFRESGVVPVDWRGSRARVVQYCSNHPEEVRLIPRIQLGSYTA